MAKISEYIRWYSTKEEPVTVGDYSVTPFSQTLAVQIPHFSFSWNRPTAVIVESGGEAQRLRIPDVTRISQLGIVLTGLAIMLLYWRPGRR